MKPTNRHILYAHNIHLYIYDNPIHSEHTPTTRQQDSENDYARIIPKTGMSCAQQQQVFGLGTPIAVCVYMRCWERTDANAVECIEWMYLDTLKETCKQISTPQSHFYEQMIFILPQNNLPPRPLLSSKQFCQRNAHRHYRYVSPCNESNEMPTCASKSYTTWFLD